MNIACSKMFNCFLGWSSVSYPALQLTVPIVLLTVHVNAPSCAPDKAYLAELEQCNFCGQMFSPGPRCAGGRDACPMLLITTSS